MLPNDTDPRVQAMLVEGYRRMTPSQKLAIVHGLTTTVHQLALTDIRSRHPHADEREQRLRLISRWVDAATMRRVFGWDPDTKGH